MSEEGGGAGGVWAVEGARKFVFSPGGKPPTTVPAVSKGGMEANLSGFVELRSIYYSDVISIPMSYNSLWEQTKTLV